MTLWKRFPFDPPVDAEAILEKERAHRLVRYIACMPSANEEHRRSAIGCVFAWSSHDDYDSRMRLQAQVDELLAHAPRCVEDETPVAQTPPARVRTCPACELNVAVLSVHKCGHVAFCEYCFHGVGGASLVCPQCHCPAKRRGARIA